MSITPKEMIPGCYKAEAMGFKVYTAKDGKIRCCADLVLQDYSKAGNYIPEELTIWFSLYKKDGSPNLYAERDIKDFGKAVGSKEIAEIDTGSMFMERKVALKGTPVYILVRNKSYTTASGYSGELLETIVLPCGEYPSLSKVAGDDVPFDWGNDKQDNIKSAKDMFLGALGQPKTKPTEKIGERHEPDENCPF